VDIVEQVNFAETKLSENRISKKCVLSPIVAGLWKNQTTKKRRREVLRVFLLLIFLSDNSDFFTKNNYLCRPEKPALPGSGIAGNKQKQSG